MPRVGRWCERDAHACQRCRGRHAWLQVADGSMGNAVETLTERVCVSGLLRGREAHDAVIGGDAHRPLLGIDPLCSLP